MYMWIFNNTHYLPIFNVSVEYTCVLLFYTLQQSFFLPGRMRQVHLA